MTETYVCSTELSWIRCVVFVVCCRYEIGEALYIGWASGVLAICGGACLMFSCKLGSKEKTWVALSLSHTHSHTFLFSIWLSFHIICSYNIFPILVIRWICVSYILHLALAAVTPTSPREKQFTLRPHPGEKLRALMEEMLMSKWSNSGQFHG